MWQRGGERGEMARLLLYTVSNLQHTKFKSFSRLQNGLLGNKEGPQKADAESAISRLH